MRMGQQVTVKNFSPKYNGLTAEIITLPVMGQKTKVWIVRVLEDGNGQATKGQALQVVADQFEPLPEEQEAPKVIHL